MLGRRSWSCYLIVALKKERKRAILLIILKVFVEKAQKGEKRGAPRRTKSQ
jgi:hypothetical protein